MEAASKSTSSLEGIAIKCRYFNPVHRNTSNIGGAILYISMATTWGRKYAHITVLGVQMNVVNRPLIIIAGDWNDVPIHLQASFAELCGVKANASVSCNVAVFLSRQPE